LAEGVHSGAPETDARGNVVSAWSWPRSDVVRLVVTVVGPDGRNVYRYCDLRPGREHAETIELPDGPRTVTIERPVRERVDLGQHRKRRK
jgi:hypothetical protein